MRLFIAAELPAEMLEALAETSALLRGSVRGRYVAPDSFHVTLAFLGDVESRCIDDISCAMDSSCGNLHAAEAVFGGLGSFGRRSSATLWQGFEDPGVMPEAAEKLRAELGARGYSFDAKKFIAHVTLMRSANISSGNLPTPVGARGDVDSIVLFHSDLSGPRPVYEPLHCLTLL